MPAPKLKAVYAEDFTPRFTRAAMVAHAYAISELGWVRAKVVAAVEDVLCDDVFLVKLEVGETENPDHDCRILTLLVRSGEVTDEGDDDFWYANAID